MKKESGIIGRAWELQHKIEVRQERIGKGKYGRVLKMARKPTNEEYEKTAKITAAGILAVGALGFAIYIIIDQLIPWILSAIGY